MLQLLYRLMLYGVELTASANRKRFVVRNWARTQMKITSAIQFQSKPIVPNVHKRNSAKRARFLHFTVEPSESCAAFRRCVLTVCFICLILCISIVAGAGSALHAASSRWEPCVRACCAVPFPLYRATTRRGQNTNGWIFDVCREADLFIRNCFRIVQLYNFQRYNKQFLTTLCP